MLRHAKPDTTAIYTHGNFGKALDAQRVYMEQLLRMKPASESTQMTSSGWHRVGKLVSRTTSLSQVAASSEVRNGGRYRIRTYDFHRVKMALYR